MLVLGGVPHLSYSAMLCCCMSVGHSDVVGSAVISQAKPSTAER